MSGFKVYFFISKFGSTAAVLQLQSELFSLPIGGVLVSHIEIKTIKS